MFMLDSIAVVVMVYMGLRDDRRAPGVKHTSLFRTIEDEQEARPRVSDAGPLF